MDDSHNTVVNLPWLSAAKHVQCRNKKCATYITAAASASSLVAEAAMTQRRNEARQPIASQQLSTLIGRRSVQ